MSKLIVLGTRLFGSIIAKDITKLGVNYKIAQS